MAPRIPKHAGSAPLPARRGPPHAGAGHSLSQPRDAQAAGLDFQTVAANVLPPPLTLTSAHSMCEAAAAAAAAAAVAPAPAAAAAAADVAGASTLPGLVKLITKLPTAIYQSALDAAGRQDSETLLDMELEVLDAGLASMLSKVVREANRNCPKPPTCKLGGINWAKEDMAKSHELAKVLTILLLRMDYMPLEEYCPDAECMMQVCLPPETSILMWSEAARRLTVRLHRKYLPVSKKHGDAPFRFVFLLRKPDTDGYAFADSSTFLVGSKEGAEAVERVDAGADGKRKRKVAASKPTLQPLSQHAGVLAGVRAAVKRPAAAAAAVLPQAAAVPKRTFPAASRALPPAVAAPLAAPTSTPRAMLHLSPELRAAVLHEAVAASAPAFTPAPAPAPAPVGFRLSMVAYSSAAPAAVSTVQHSPQHAGLKRGAASIASPVTAFLVGLERQESGGSAVMTTTGALPPKRARFAEVLHQAPTPMAAAEAGHSMELPGIGSPLWGGMLLPDATSSSTLFSALPSGGLALNHSAFSFDTSSKMSPPLSAFAMSEPGAADAELSDIISTSSDEASTDEGGCSSSSQSSMSMSPLDLAARDAEPFAL